MPAAHRTASLHSAHFRSRALSLLALSCAALVSWSAPAAAEDWPQFRGPNCSGVSASTLELPVTFSSSEAVRWSVEVGDGICSPTVSAGRVFTTAMVGQEPEETRFVVSCFDAAGGEPIWQREFAAGPKPLPPIHEMNSYASATPAADSERVYVYFTRIGLVALDVSTGSEVWTFNLPEPFFIFDWGPGMSPVLHGDMLLFCQDDDLNPALYAINKHTGELIWKDDRSDMAVCYSHPIICQTENGPELVVAGTGKLIGYDLADGRRKWASEIFCRNIKTTPVTHDGVIYVSVESYGISYQWRATADSNGDGRITREEIKASRKDKQSEIPDEFWAKFERGDTNGDGVLEGEEIDKAFLDPSNKGGLLANDVQARAGNETDVTKFDDELQKEASIQAVRGGGSGDVSRTHVLWKEKNKAPDHLVSPLVVDGRMLLVKGGGISSCFDAATGQQLWYRKRLGEAGTFLASPVAGDGKIYVASQEGQIIVLESGPELKVLATNDMGEACIGTPAIADGRLYIRTRTKLYCIDN